MPAGRRPGSRASSAESGAPVSPRATRFSARRTRSSTEPEETLEKGLPEVKRPRGGAKKAAGRANSKSASPQAVEQKTVRRSGRRTRSQPQEPDIAEEPEEELVEKEVAIVNNAETHTLEDVSSTVTHKEISIEVPIGAAESPSEVTETVTSTEIVHSATPLETLKTESDGLFSDGEVHSPSASQRVEPITRAKRGFSRQVATKDSVRASTPPSTASQRQHTTPPITSSAPFTSSENAEQEAFQPASLIDDEVATSPSHIALQPLPSPSPVGYQSSSHSAHSPSSIDAPVAQSVTRRSTRSNHVTRATSGSPTKAGSSCPASDSAEGFNASTHASLGASQAEAIDISSSSSSESGKDEDNSELEIHEEAQDLMQFDDDIEHGEQDETDDASDAMPTYDDDDQKSMVSSEDNSKESSSLADDHDDYIQNLSPGSDESLLSPLGSTPSLPESPIAVPVYTVDESDDSLLTSSSPTTNSSPHVGDNPLTTPAQTITDPLVMPAAAAQFPSEVPVQGEVFRDGGLLEVIYTHRATQTTEQTPLNTLQRIYNPVTIYTPSKELDLPQLAESNNMKYPPVDAHAAFRGAEMLQSRMQAANQTAMSLPARMWIGRGLQNEYYQDILNDKYLFNIAANMTDMEKANFLVYQRAENASLNEQIERLRREREEVVTGQQLAPPSRERVLSPDEIIKASSQPLGSLYPHYQNPRAPRSGLKRSHEDIDPIKEAEEASRPAKILKVSRSRIGKVSVHEENGKNIPNACHLLLETDEKSRSAEQQQAYYSYYDRLSLVDKRKIQEFRAERAAASSSITPRRLPARRGFSANSFRNKRELVTAADVARKKSESVANASGARTPPQGHTVSGALQSATTQAQTQTPATTAASGWGLRGFFGSVRRFLPGTRTEPVSHVAPPVTSFAPSPPAHQEQPQSPEHPPQFTSDQPPPQNTQQPPSSPVSPLASRGAPSHDSSMTGNDNQADNSEPPRADGVGAADVNTGLFDTGITAESFLPTNQQTPSSRRNSTGPPKPRRTTEERQRALKAAEERKAKIEAELKAATQEEEDLRKAIEEEEVGHTIGKKRRRVVRIDDLESIPGGQSSGSFDLNSAYFNYSSDEDEHVEIDDSGKVERVTPANKRVRFSSPAEDTSQSWKHRNNSNARPRRSVSRRLADQRAASLSNTSAVATGSINVFDNLSSNKMEREKRERDLAKAMTLGQKHGVWTGPKVSAQPTSSASFNISGSFAVPDNADSDSDSELSSPIREGEASAPKTNEDLLVLWLSFNSPEFELNDNDDEVDRLHKPQLKAGRFRAQYKVTSERFADILLLQQQKLATPQKPQNNIFDQVTQPQTPIFDAATAAGAQGEPSALTRARSQADAHKPKTPSALSKMSNVNSPSSNASTTPSFGGSPMSWTTNLSPSNQQNQNQNQTLSPSFGFNPSNVQFGSMNAIASGTAAPFSAPPHDSASPMKQKSTAATFASMPAQATPSQAVAAQGVAGKEPQSTPPASNFTPTSQQAKSTPQPQQPLSQPSQEQQEQPDEQQDQEEQIQPQNHDPMVTIINGEEFRWPGSQPWPLPPWDPKVEAEFERTSKGPEYEAYTKLIWKECMDHYTIKKARERGEDVEYPPELPPWLTYRRETLGLVD